ncbi:MAG: GNAT family N-acetyltransferase [Nocardioides sp.]
MPLLRPMTDADLPDVLALNDRNVESTAPMDEARLRFMREAADRADVLEHDGAFAGFVITYAPGSAYDGEKYLWFSARYEHFCYLDRIVLHESVRRRGLGTFVYDEVEDDAARRFGRLLLEVNVVPPNEPSLAFHAGRGYVEVGRTGPADHLTAMMEKKL